MRLILTFVILIHALFTLGCATRAETVTVEVPVPTPCLVDADIPAPAAIKTEDELLKLNRRIRTLTVWDERLTLKQEADLLRALIIACTGGS